MAGFRRSDYVIRELDRVGRPGLVDQVGLGELVARAQCGRMAVSVGRSVEL